jgi:hypothetical protein
VSGLTLRSTRTPLALSSALSLVPVSSASLSISVQAGPVSFIRYEGEMMGIHSKILVHWTGKDIEKSQDDKRPQLYVERLKNDLQAGRNNCQWRQRGQGCRRKDHEKQVFRLEIIKEYTLDFVHLPADESLSDRKIGGRWMSAAVVSFYAKVQLETHWL